MANAILPESSPRTIRSFARPLPPVREPRRTPRPAEPFGAGILPEPLKPIVLQVRATSQGSVALLEWPERFVVVFTPFGGSEVREEYGVLSAAQSRFRQLTRHSPADEAWWRANSPTCRVDFYVEGQPDPSDPFNWSMPAAEYQHEEWTPSLSDDANGQFGYVREGGEE